MRIAGLERFSTVDWPGMLSAVIFTQGCRWNCWYCHNRQSMDGVSHISEEEVIQFLTRRKNRLDSVVITGGEPTLQPDLAHFLQRIRALGYLVKLDTNGGASDVVRAVTADGLVDYIAVDLKGPPEQYCQLGCGPAADVQKTVQILREAGVNFEVRTTVLPGMGRDELRAMCRFVGPVPLYALQIYRENGRAAATRSDLEVLADAIADLMPNIVVRA